MYVYMYIHLYIQGYEWFRVKARWGSLGLFVWLQVYLQNRFDLQVMGQLKDGSFQRGRYIEYIRGHIGGHRE